MLMICMAKHDDVFQLDTIINYHHHHHHHQQQQQQKNNNKNKLTSLTSSTSYSFIIHHSSPHLPLGPIFLSKWFSKQFHHFRCTLQQHTAPQDLEEFLYGCMRLRGEAKALDLAKLMHSHAWSGGPSVFFCFRGV